MGHWICAFGVRGKDIPGRGNSTGAGVEDRERCGAKGLAVGGVREAPGLSNGRRWDAGEVSKCKPLRPSNAKEQGLHPGGWSVPKLCSPITTPTNISAAEEG